MAEDFKALELLKNLDNFSDPVGPSAQLQTDRLMKELRRAAERDPEMLFRIDEHGPEKTLRQILDELDKEAAELASLRQALANEDPE